jgi:hypothetical protein
MAEKQKPRKSHPGHHAEPNWRNKQSGNSSNHRYRREVVLEKFVPSESFPIPVPDDILLVYLAESELPANKSDKFVHGLGETVSSRKFVPRERNEKGAHHENSKKIEEEVKNASEVKISPQKKEFSEIWDAHEEEDLKSFENFSRSEGNLRKKESLVDVSGVKRKEENCEKSDGVKRNEEKGNDDKGIKIESEKKDLPLNVKNEKKQENDKKEKKLDKKIEVVESNLTQKKEEKKDDQSSKEDSHGQNPDTHQKKTDSHLQKTDLQIPNSDSPKTDPHIKTAPVLQKSETPLPKPETQKKPEAASQARSIKKSESFPDPSKPNPQIISESGKKSSLKNIPKKDPQDPQDPSKSSEKKNETNSISQKSENLPKDFPSQPDPTPSTEKLPSFEKSTLQAFSDQGSPFARILLLTGLEDLNNQKVSFPAGLKVYQRLWFYKDLQGSVQGPFSCLEMFDWVVRGHLPEDLMISFCNNEFAQMKKYQSKPRKIQSEEKKVVKEEVKVLKGVWGDSSKLFSNKK